jgi:hypothetical protein
MTDRRWRHPWQVVRCTQGAVAPRCSHRWEVTAGWCSGLRDLPLVIEYDRGFHHDVRRTPSRAAEGGN